MRSDQPMDERLNTFSDGVVAVVITIMVLELKAPDASTLGALWPLWPTVASYAVSYLFIAIVWINHRHLMRYARHATPRLVWVNFAHLFAVSLVPFTTSWVARTHMAPLPVALYAALFVIINAAFRVFEAEVLAQAGTTQMCQHMRRMVRRRSLVTLSMFAAAAIAALLAPLAGFGLVCAALFLYLEPRGPARWLQPMRAIRHAK